MSTLTITLDEVALGALNDLADRTGRSREAVVTQAIEAYVTQNDWQIAKINAGLAAAEAGDFAGDSEVARVASKFTGSA